MVDSFVVVTLVAFAVSVFVTIVSGLSRLMTRRYEAMRYREFVGFNPPAVLMTLYGRAWPYACKAAIISGSALVMALLVAVVA